MRGRDVHRLSDGKEHLALGFGDVFGSEQCDCGPQLREVAERITLAGGWLLYLRQEGRGIGRYAKLDVYALQDAGLDTYQANVALGRGEDDRDYTAVAEMLAALGLPQVDHTAHTLDLTGVFMPAA